MIDRPLVRSASATSCGSAPGSEEQADPVTHTRTFRVSWSRLIVITCVTPSHPGRPEYVRVCANLHMAPTVHAGHDGSTTRPPPAGFGGTQSVPASSRGPPRAG